MLPTTFIVQCPMCRKGLEAKLCGWQLMRAHTEDGYGMALEMTAYVAHECEGP